MTASTDTSAEHPITPLFEFVKTLGDGDDIAAAGVLDEVAPPYPILLALLMDWAGRPESENSPDLDVYETLLSRALHKMRVELRQGRSEARDFWQVLRESLGDALADASSPLLCQSLLHHLAMLDFPVPADLIERAGQWYSAEFVRLSDLGDMEDQSQSAEAILDSMLDGSEPTSAIDIYDLLKPQLYYLPVDGVDIPLQLLLRSTQPLAREAGLLFLLHPRELVRDHLLAALTQPGILDGIDARGRDRLIMLRNWLPAEQSARLDPVIKKLRLRNLPAAGTEHDGSIELWVFAMDGSGATAVITRKRQGKRYWLSGAILKEQVGIVDCWRSPLKKKEAERTLDAMRQNLPPGWRVNHDFLEHLVPHFLALNCDSGELPEPILLEWLEHLGGAFWQPNLLDHGEWLSKMQAELDRLDRDAAFRRCARWYNRHVEELAWFENDDATRECAIGIVTSEPNEALDDWDQLLEPHRLKWRDRFVQLAIAAQCNTQGKSKPAWQDFALLADGLDRGDPFVDLPIMPAVAADTLEMITAELEAEDMEGDLWDDEFEGDEFFPEMPPVAQSQKIPRNAPCPCGSGKKYKRCCMP